MKRGKTDLVVTGYIFNENNELLLIHHNKLNKWLPVGGHMEQNETPDEAMLREALEETGLNVEIVGKKNLDIVGSVKENLAVPFHVNVHNVGDHDHCSFFYICRAKGRTVTLQEAEVGGFKWLTKEGLNQDFVPDSVRSIGLEAFKSVEENGFI